jgi:hypothetical protein
MNEIFLSTFRLKFNLKNISYKYFENNLVTLVYDGEFKFGYHKHCIGDLNGCSPKIIWIIWKNLIKTNSKIN